MPPRHALLLAAVVSSLLTMGGCLTSRYLMQAGAGQFDLLTRARPIDEILYDPEVPLSTRELLAELDELKTFGRKAGLRIKRQYLDYVEVAPEATVWFVGAADPLSFKSRRFCFPIAGCFTGLGWFDLDEALIYQKEMRAKGYDVFVRPAAAYSTGGWFPDPVTSAMLTSGPSSLVDLANVIFHESVHATVLIHDQMFFNESFAEFIGDALTIQYFNAKHGEGNPLVAEFLADEVWRETRVQRLMTTYKELAALYAGTASRADKLAKKEKIIDSLVADLRLQRRPNNASLIEVRLYKGGQEQFAGALTACGTVPALLRASKRLRKRDFKTTMQEDLAPVATRLVALCGKK